MIYLYVKEHSVTGLKYFGKTGSKDPFKYPGSGVDWKKHIDFYGKELIRTIELWGFDTQELCTEFAIEFSIQNNIVESDKWANMQIENGKNGPLGQTGEKSHTFGRKPSEKTLEKMKERRGEKNPFYGKTHSEETKEFLSNLIKGKTGELCHNFGKTHSEDTKKKMSLKKKNISLSDEHKKKISYSIQGEKNGFYGKTHSKETKILCGIKISEKTKGVKKKIITCPHCEKSGGSSQMKRWHFDNCRSLI